MTLRSVPLLLGCAALCAACSDPAKPPGASVMIDGASSVLVDTVRAFRLVQATVRGEDGAPAAGVQVELSAEGGYFTDDPQANGGWTRVNLQSDVAGRVGANLLLSPVAGSALVRAVTGSLEDVLLIDKRPGAFARLLAVPAETALAVGRPYTMAVSAGDRYGNPRPDGIAALAQQSLRPDVASASGGVITALAPGRATIRLESAGVVDSAYVNVMPPGSVMVFDTISVGPAALLDLESEAVVALPGVQQGDCPAWHPDGTRVLLHGLRLFTPGGTAVELLPADADLDARCGQLTADGAWIFFEVRVLPNVSQIWRIRTDGSGLEQLTPDENSVDAYSPSPSPDGARFAYVLRDPMSAMNARFIVVRDVATGAVDTISPRLVDPQSVNYPRTTVAWSPSGMWIAYTSVGDNFFFSVRSWAWGSHVNVVRPDGSDMRRITDSRDAPRNFRDGELSWSPDGRWLIAKLHYVDLRLALIDIETDDVLPLNGHSRGFILPVWRPD